VKLFVSGFYMFSFSDSRVWGDCSGFMDKIHEVISTDEQPNFLRKQSEESFLSRRLMYEQFQDILKLVLLARPIASILEISLNILSKPTW
jgi:signal recognition particle subunit SRP54